MYRVNDSHDLVEVCASVIGKVVLERNVVLQYRITNKTALDMEGMFD